MLTAGPDISAIEAQFDDARRRTLALLAPVAEKALGRQWSPLQSPLVWDLAHIGYFEELWISRGLGGQEPLLREGDELYDAFAHVRSERGELPILRPAAAREYLDAVRERTLATLARVDLESSDRLLARGYAFGLVVQHELQHNETMLQTLQVSGLVHPGGGPAPVSAAGVAVVPAGLARLGVDGEEPWAYDNERPAHEVEVEAFAIDRAPVTNDEYRAFVEAGGYRDERWWSEEGRAWLEESGAEAPLFWEDGAIRRFGVAVPLEPAEPVQHVCFHEAEAFARSAGKRLPTEAEWEAAARAGVLADVGAVWEWTSSPFLGYPGFVAFPYAEYSEVFFGDEYRVLRGGSWATHPTVARTSFRNWDYPIRRQIFAGLRCASDA
jgi:gamma-glutamyl hercynylcysteine S-oxide synthase